jgi:hypothetical protein
MTMTYDLFWSFRSPYSYLVTPRLIEFEREYDVKANVRPVYPIAVRIDGFFKNVHPLWWAYLRRDVARTAQMLGMLYSPPNPDPIVMNLQTGEVTGEDQGMPPAPRPTSGKNGAQNDVAIGASVGATEGGWRVNPAHRRVEKDATTAHKLAAPGV